MLGLAVCDIEGTVKVILGMSLKISTDAYCSLSYKYSFNLHSVFSPMRWASIQNLVMMKVNLSGPLVCRKLDLGEDCVSKRRQEVW